MPAAPTAAAPAAVGAAPNAAAPVAAQPPGPLASGPPPAHFPWEVPRSEVARLPWEGLQGDLPGLLAAQARGREVAALLFSEDFAPLALNCYASLVAIGRAPNVVVAAVGGASLERCVSLRLPCLDAGRLLAAAGPLAPGAPRGGAFEEPPSAGAASAARARGGDWARLVWAKTLVAHAVNALGYDILFAGALP
jgi:hypothetical protein